MRILVCDDDATFAEKCKNKIITLAEKNGVEVTVQLAESASQLLFFIDTKYAGSDIVYLDYNMPGENGMEAARELRRRHNSAEIIFCTVDDSHAIEGYDVDALHYIVKGRVSDEKFEEIFLKAVLRTKKRNEELLSLSCAGDHRNIPIEDIVYFEVQNRIVTVHYRGKGGYETFEFYSTLSKLEELLYGKGFLRIHKSYLVLEKNIRRTTLQTVEMSDNTSLPIGRSYRNLV